MSYLSNAAVLACVAVVSMGLTGCDSKTTTAEQPPVGEKPPVVEVPDYAKPVVVDQETAQKALASIEDGGMFMNSASAEDGSKASANVQSKAAEKLKSIKISDNAYPVAPAINGSDSIDVTLDCAYSGSYHLVAEWEGSMTGHSDTAEITFDNCVHSYPLIEMVMGGLQESFTPKFTHTGSLKSESNYTNFEGIEQGAKGMSAVNLSMVHEIDGVKEFELAANGEMAMERYYSHPVERYEMSIDGTLSLTGFDENGTAEGGFSIEGIAFNATSAYVDGENTSVMNGYLGFTLTVGNETDTWYVYGEGFAAVWSSGPVPLSTHITSETYDGVLGTDCIGGTVTFATTATWETNSSQQDINNNWNQTPFAGTTTISGADSSSAIVNFASNDDNKSYGTITVGEVESDPMTRPEMTEGVCEAL